MTEHLLNWSGLLIRWAHLIAGISWIGSSFYFMWLDSHIAEPEKPKEGVEGELWMVHSGGFYQVEKRLIMPGQMPKTLHWFKWEATFTWITGIILLAIVYYFTGGAYLLDPEVSKITEGAAIALGIGLVIASWFVYDGIYQSPLGKKEYLPEIISFALLIGLIYFLCHTLSGRAAYIHVGAILGTLMVTNVWVRILPAQQQMIDATQAGRKPDYLLGKHAKRRSVHNSYLTFPVLFIMLSNHYASTFAHPQGWLILILLFIFGAGTRHLMIAKRLWVLLPVLASLLAVMWMTYSAPQQQAGTQKVSFNSVKQIFSQRCVVCHANQPQDATFGPAPGGVNFEVVANIKSLAERIRFRTVETKTMPLANKTGMTQEERDLIGTWIAQGATLE